MNRRSFLRSAFAGAVSLPFAALVAAEVVPSVFTASGTWTGPFDVLRVENITTGMGGAGGSGRWVGSGGGAGSFVYVHVDHRPKVSS